MAEAKDMIDRAAAKPMMKAQSFRSLLAALQSLIGTERLGRFVAALPPDVQELVRTPPMPMLWIDGEIFHRIHDAIESAVAPGQPEFFCQLAREQFRNDLGTVYKVLVRMMSPHKMFSKAATLYSTYTTDGRLEATALSERSGEVAVIGLAQPRVSLLHYMSGTVAAVVEATGGTPTIDILERGPTFRYSVKW